VHVSRSGTHVEIHAATVRDAEEVASLADRFFAEEGFVLPEGGLGGRVERYLVTEGHAIFLARGGGRPVAFATVATGFGLEYGWLAELEDLYVVPEERRRGIARTLVDRAANWAAGRGCSAVLVTVTPEGERAHTLTDFYTRLGFQDRGRRLLERSLA
jgi:aminoglycoside 6'-N-acetyltransferase I